MFIKKTNHLYFVDNHYFSSDPDVSIVLYNCEARAS